MRKGFAFLEEDCDLTLFIETLKAKDITPQFRDHTGDKHSKIRGYDMYTIDKTLEQPKENS